MFKQALIFSFCVCAEDNNDIDNEGDDKEGVELDRAPLAEPGSTSSKPDAKA